MKKKHAFALRSFLAVVLPISAYTVIHAATLLPPTPCFEGVCAEVITEPTPSPEPSPSPPTPPPGQTPGTNGDISWNPGWYYSENTSKSKDKVTKEYPVREAHEILPYVTGRRWCNDPSTKFQGIRLKFHWKDLEPTKGNYRFDITDAWFNAVAQCAAGPKRILLNTDFVAFNAHAGTVGGANAPQSCVPEDLATRKSMVHWDKGKSGNEKAICVGRVWDPKSPAYSRYKDMYIAFVARYKDHPLFEGSSSKGEGALGIGDADENAAQYGGTVFDQNNYNSRIRELGRAVRAVAPKKMALFGTNFHGGSNASAQDRYRRYLTLMDSEAGFGWRCPDVFALKDRYDIPRTLHEQFLLSQNYAGMYPQGCETQNPGDSRYGSIIDEILPKMKQAVYRHPRFDGSATFPPDATNNNASHQATHPVAIVRDSGPGQWATATGWKAAFDKHGWDLHYEACPTAWTGVTCRTGETTDDPGSVTR